MLSRLYPNGATSLIDDQLKLASCLALMFPAHESASDEIGIVSARAWFQTLTLMQGKRGTGTYRLPKEYNVELVNDKLLEFPLRAHDTDDVYVTMWRRQASDILHAACIAKGTVIVPCCNADHAFVIFLNFARSCLEVVDSNYVTPLELSCQRLFIVFRRWVLRSLGPFLPQSVLAVLVTMRPVSATAKGFFTIAKGPQGLLGSLPPHKLIKVGSCVAWSACLGYLRTFWPADVAADVWLVDVAAKFVGSKMPSPAQYYGALLRLTIQLLQAADFHHTFIDGEEAYEDRITGRVFVRSKYCRVIHAALEPHPKAHVTIAEVKQFLAAATIVGHLFERRRRRIRETGVARTTEAFGTAPAACHACIQLPFVALVWYQAGGSYRYQTLVLRSDASSWQSGSLLVTASTFARFHGVVTEYVAEPGACYCVVMNAAMHTLAAGCLLVSGAVKLMQWQQTHETSHEDVTSRFCQAVAFSALLAVLTRRPKTITFPFLTAAFPVLQLVHTDGARYVPVTNTVYVLRRTAAVVTTPKFSVNADLYSEWPRCAIQDHSGQTFMRPETTARAFEPPLAPGEYAWCNGQAGYCVTKYDATRHAYIVTRIRGRAKIAFACFQTCAEPEVLAVDCSLVTDNLAGLGLAFEPDPCGCSHVVVVKDQFIDTSLLYVVTNSHLAAVTASAIQCSAAENAPPTWRVRSDGTFYVFSASGCMLARCYVGATFVLDCQLRLTARACVSAVVRVIQRLGAASKLVLTAAQYEAVASMFFVRLPFHDAYVWHRHWASYPYIEVSTPTRFAQFVVQKRGDHAFFLAETHAPMSFSTRLPDDPGVYVRLGGADETTGNAIAISTLHIDAKETKIVSWSWAFADDAQTAFAAAMLSALPPLAVRHAARYAHVIAGAAPFFDGAVAVVGDTLTTTHVTHS